MAGPAKNRINEQQKATPSRQTPQRSVHSSSGVSSSSSSGRNTASPAVSSARSQPSAARSARTNVSRVGGYDGNADPAPQPERDPNTAKVIVDPRNFDLGIAGWATVRGTDLVSKPQREAPSKLGQATKIGLNTYHVESFPNIVVYQYEVMIGKGEEKRGAIEKVWNSKPVQAEMGGFTIFDGNRLAWSGKPLAREVRLTVDLDVEQGRQPKVKSDKNIFRVHIRQTNKVGFQSLMAHLQGKASFDNTCLEAINFADHLLRETPSKKFVSIKRSFFPKGGQPVDLGGGVNALKGVYQSLRLVHPGRLSVNMDVANGTFWQAIPLVQAAVLFCGARDPADLAAQLNRGGEKGLKGKQLKRMRKLHVMAKHRGKAELDEYVIDSFIYISPKDYKVQVTDPSGKEVEMTLYSFFMKKYSVTINYSGLPLVKMTKGKNTVLPMEVLKVKENQRYAYKMDERQTSNMIKFAVTAPGQRYQHIQEGMKMLDWANDPVLNKYGVKINPNKTIVDARVLVAPTVKFGVGDAKPGTSGRWDLKGKKFLTTNSAPLKSWAVCVVSGRRGGKPDKTVVENFIKAFVSGYINHGGKVENKQPSMVLGGGDDVGTWVTNTWNAAGNQAQSRPQILLFILPDKDSQVYGRIKRSCECRYGVVSQCVQYAHAQKAQPQYISNVCMKFNCKLGGATCRAIGPKTGGATGIFQVPTMVIGADVSHSAPGVQAPSMAAMTISTDRLATRYAALVQTNGYRGEMINTDIIKNELKPMLQHWVQQVGGGKLPAQIIYIRDGVSEGQYNQVLQQEVMDMKQLVKTADPSANVKFLVVIGSKRHHVRFFPDKGDRNGNAFPGTLVETGVTNPFENDFYLCSHAAIKGTARPAHYYVLLNEPAMSNDMLHTLLYEHAYQYQRASTPISQHPAIYYAHLAAARAGPHDPKWAGSTDGPSTEKKQSGSQSGSQAGRSGTRGSSSGVPAEFDKLMPMPNQGGIATSMWYI
ncbi:Protein argonaute [Cercospora beticola]|uniref:Protein argonaute n=1 Tax=Cercospora beticola TaxID=122368 RepID=A0A2G5I0A9_CERBT|nr:Protein argonaute [Cercospora beticola]PIA98245.1 Protein argonaute [Cercospora beticola]WPA98170.1 hypothetical protein RHO25_002781 [Cercospora beticola]